MEKEKTNPILVSFGILLIALMVSLRIAPDFFNIYGQQIGGTILTVAVVTTLFLAFRALVLWYWKVGRVIKLLEKIEENTRK